MDNANKIQDMYESYELEIEELELQGTRKLAETIIIYKNKNNTLNKDIDELIEKYQKYVDNIQFNMSLTNNMSEKNIEKYDKEISKVWQKHEFYKNIIQDLKKLKGE